MCLSPSPQNLQITHSWTISMSTDVFVTCSLNLGMLVLLVRRGLILKYIFLAEQRTSSFNSLWFWPWLAKAVISQYLHLCASFSYYLQWWVGFFSILKNYFYSLISFSSFFSPKPELPTYGQTLYSADIYIHCSSKALPFHQIFGRGYTKEKLWDAEPTIE